MMWPNPEDLAAEILAHRAPVVTFLPSDLQARLPLLRVRSLGGSDDEVTDISRVAVDAYAATRDQAWDLARGARHDLVDRPTATAAGLLDRAETEVGPQEIPYGNRAVRYVTATYRLHARRTAAEAS